MKQFLFILSIINTGLLHAQNPSFAWAGQMGGSSQDHSKSITIDGVGNIYTTGDFEGTADFDPGPGVYNLNSIGIKDAFISKLDANGNFIWAKQLGGYGAMIESLSIATDASGNVCITGWFMGTVDSDPGVAVFPISSYNDAIFITKLDANGNLAWTKIMEYDYYVWDSVSYGYAICADTDGNIYTTGYFKGAVDFDPGPGYHDLYINSSAIFVSKLDASGNFVWAKSLGDNLNNIGTCIRTDVSGNVFITGKFGGLGDFDPGPGTFLLQAGGTADIFITKLNSSGNFLWAKSMVGQTNNVANSIAIDINGNSYTTGTFSGTVDFDPGTGIFNIISESSNTDIFISKLNAAGDFVWAKKIGGPGMDYGYSIALDALGNVYTTGDFTSTADLDPGIGVSPVSSMGGTDVFISKLDPSGNFIFGKSMGGYAADNGTGIAIQGPGNLIISGTFRGTANLDPIGNNTFFSSVGPSDVFIVKLTQGGVLPVTLANITAIKKAAGVQVDWQVWQEINIDRYEVERSFDGQQFSNIGTVPALKNQANVIDYHWFDPAPFTGINYYRLRIIEPGNFKYSKVVKVIIDKAVNNEISVFPNPYTNGSLTILSNDISKGLYNINISNILGQLLYTVSIHHAGGIFKQSIHPSIQFSKGIYQVQLIGAGKQAVSNLVVE